MFLITKLCLCAANKSSPPQGQPVGSSLFGVQQLPLLSSTHLEYTFWLVIWILRTEDLGLSEVFAKEFLLSPCAGTAVCAGLLCPVRSIPRPPPVQTRHREDSRHFSSRCCRRGRWGREGEPGGRQGRGKSRREPGIPAAAPGGRGAPGLSQGGPGPRGTPGTPRSAPPGPSSCPQPLLLHPLAWPGLPRAPPAPAPLAPGFCPAPGPPLPRARPGIPAALPRGRIPRWARGKGPSRARGSPEGGAPPGPAPARGKAAAQAGPASS